MIHEIYSCKWNNIFFSVRFSFSISFDIYIEILWVLSTYTCFCITRDMHITKPNSKPTIALHVWLKICCCRRYWIGLYSLFFVSVKFWIQHMCFLSSFILFYSLYFRCTVQTRRFFSWTIAFAISLHSSFIRSLFFFLLSTSFHSYSNIFFGFFLIYSRIKTQIILVFTYAKRY